MIRKHIAARFRPSWLFSVIAAGALATLIAGNHSAASEVTRRHLANPREVYREIRLGPESEAKVRQYFPSFLQYQDLMLYRPEFGYYASGRVSFTEDYQTFPNLLAPYFGQMIAQQIFRMWDGMRREGTLGQDEKFTIAEFGGGNGVLAESILDYVGRQSRENSGGKWRELNSQLIYICYDLAPALNAVQLRRNVTFGSHFEARQGDATNMTGAIPPASMKGVILSNELLDVFPVHKVIFSEDGSAEVAFVTPFLPRSAWDQIQSRLLADAANVITTGDKTIHGIFSPGEQVSNVFLTREALVAFLKSVAGWEDYVSMARSIQFHEVYLPARTLPELAGHIARYAHNYASQIARRGSGAVAYVNLGEEKFIDGAARVLNAGYVVTIDYGSNWDGIVSSGQPHMRTYGPGNLESVLSVPSRDLTSGSGASGTTGSSAWASQSSSGLAGWIPNAAGREGPNPYRWPSLNDITTDVNFGLLAAEGRRSGMRTIYFGPQKALRSKTSISARSAHPKPGSLTGEKQQTFWSQFETAGEFKLLIQQKTGTDNSYTYPDTHPEVLETGDAGIGNTQYRRSVAIEQRLREIGNQLAKQF